MRASAIRKTRGELRRNYGRSRQMGRAATQLAQVGVLASTLGQQARRNGVHGTGGAAGRLTKRPGGKAAVAPYLIGMPHSKHRRRGKPRLRGMLPPRPPRHQITDEERREDALLT